MKVEIIKCLEDNFSYILINEANRNCCVVDPGEADPIINYLDTRQSLFKYTVDLHNQVNKRLGRKYMPYEDVVELYRRWFNQNEIRSKTMNFALLCGILMIAYFVYKRYTK